MPSAKIFRNGQSQAVRLPKEFAMPGREVFIRRVGAMVVLIPMVDPWSGIEAALGQFSSDFMSERAQPMPDTRDTL